MVECSFDIPAEKFSIKFPKVSVQNPKEIVQLKAKQNLYSFWKIVSPKYFLLDM